MDLKLENGGVQEDKGLGLKQSLPYPSVQEIVRKDPQSVPERYIRQEKDRPLVFDVSHASVQIPIIDLSLLAKGDADETSKLDLACKEWGFFQIQNHGVKERILHDMKAVAAAFFELPLEEKMKFTMTANDFQGYGQFSVIYEQQTLDWNDMILLITHPPANKTFKFWPLTIPGFKEALELYSEEVMKVAAEISANVSALMGMERNYLKKMQGSLGIKLNYYPTCSRPDLVLGIGPHSDKPLLSLILQDDDISSLQIKHKEEWITVKPIPGCLVVNIGDSTEILSNGVYKSIEHRVITNEKKPRMSIAAFVSPGHEVELGPLESMVDGLNRPKMYKNIKFMDYVRKSFTMNMKGKSHTGLVKLETKY